MWVKAVPVVGLGGEETRVLRDGTFSIAGLGGMVVHQTLTRLVWGAPDLEITLG